MGRFCSSLPLKTLPTFRLMSYPIWHLQELVRFRQSLRNEFCFSSAAVQRSPNKNRSNVPSSPVYGIMTGFAGSPTNVCLTPLRPHESEVSTGFHSTNPNFTPLPKVACVCYESHPGAGRPVGLTVWCLLGAVWFAFSLWTRLSVIFEPRPPSTPLSPPWINSSPCPEPAVSIRFVFSLQKAGLFSVLSVLFLVRLLWFKRPCGVFFS